MSRIRILHVSVNDLYYDIQALSHMTYDEALDFFQNRDQFGACTFGEEVINDTTPHEFTFHADGVASGDGSDTMLNWCKVDCCY